MGWSLRSCTFLIEVAYQRPPRAVATPRAFNASASCLRVLASASPLGLSDERENIGCMSVCPRRNRSQCVFAGLVEDGIAKTPRAFCSRQRLPSSRGDECAFLLGKRGDQMQPEWVYVWS